MYQCSCSNVSLLIDTGIKYDWHGTLLLNLCISSYKLMNSIFYKHKQYENA